MRSFYGYGEGAFLVAGAAGFVKEDSFSGQWCCFCIATCAVITTATGAATIAHSGHVAAARFLQHNESTAMDYIKKNNGVLLKEMNKAVFLMDAAAAGKVSFMKKLLTWGLIVLSALFVVTLYTVRKNVQIIFTLLGKNGRSI